MAMGDVLDPPAALALEDSPKKRNLGSPRQGMGQTLAMRYNASMDFNKMPKLIADRTHLNNNKAWFFFGFSSGDEDAAFLLPPQSAKGFSEQLQKMIERYEKEFGPIDMTGLETGIQSPIQPR